MYSNTPAQRVDRRSSFPGRGACKCCTVPRFIRKRRFVHAFRHFINKPFAFDCLKTPFLGIHSIFFPVFKNNFMKQAIVLCGVAAALSLVCLSANAQPIAQTDADALLNELPAPPTNLAEAHRRSFTKGATSPDAQAWYKKSMENEAEVQKLPLIEMGEYGRDRDPEKVEAIWRQAREKHCAVADAGMKDAAAMLIGFRRKTAAKIQTFNNEIQSVQYGRQYDFGIHYPLVLQTQALVIGEIHALLKNEIAVTEACAKWEEERRQGTKNR
jgi:hypothetical protein